MDGHITVDDTLEKRDVQRAATRSGDRVEDAEGDSLFNKDSELEIDADDDVDSNRNKVVLNSFHSDSNQSLRFDQGLLPHQSDSSSGKNGKPRSDEAARSIGSGGGGSGAGDASPILERLNGHHDSSLLFLSPLKKADLANGDTQRIGGDAEAQLIDGSDSQMIGYEQHSRIRSHTGGPEGDTQVIPTRSTRSNGKVNGAASSSSQGSDSLAFGGPIPQLADTQLLGDTQRIDERGGDTQRINDTQRIGGDTQRIGDTQRLSQPGGVRSPDYTQGTNDTQRIGDTQRLGDTQKIGETQRLGDTQKIGDTQKLGDTQKIEDTLEFADTQLIGDTQKIDMPLPLSESSPNKLNYSKVNLIRMSSPAKADLSSSSPMKNTPVFDSPTKDILPTPAKASSSVLQIPSTAEKRGARSTRPLISMVAEEAATTTTPSLAQVQNTQEDLIDNTFHIDNVNISEGIERPVYSSSQKNEPAEEICTDDEADVSEKQKPAQDEHDSDKENENTIDLESLQKLKEDLAPPEPKHHGGGDAPTGQHKTFPSSPKIDYSSPGASSISDELSDVDDEDGGVVVKKKRKLTVPESQSQSQLQTTASKILRKESSYILPQSRVLHEDSVWAEYKFKMYPGILQEVHRDSSVILFEDGISNVKNQDLYLLDVRIGDKVRLKKGVVQYSVTGLEKRTADSQSSSSGNGSSQDPLIQCVRGYNYVYIRRVSKNKTFDEKVVSLGEICMDISDWVEHQQKFQIGDGDLKEEKEDDSAAADTSMSSDRKILTRTNNSGLSNVVVGGASVSSISSKKILTLSRQSSTLYHKSGSSTPVSPSKRLSSAAINTGNGESVVGTKGIFSGFIFCLTNTEVDDKREEISKLIESHGGLILDQGLNEILTYGTDSENGGKLRLVGNTSFLENFKFFAVISNNYCRSAKYLQALAMGWPVLSDLYIRDCIQHKGDKTVVDSWHHYILPSGQSQRLQCIKSYDIFQFRSKYILGNSLIEQLYNNGNMLSHFNIFIITSNKGNAKNLTTCEFIFHALGAKSLGYATEYDKIRFAGEGEVLVYDNESGAASSGNTLDITCCRPERGSSGSSSAEESGRTRRTRRKTAASEKKKKREVQKAGIINWEWVVQCVIDGYAWDPSSNSKIEYRV